MLFGIGESSKQAAVTIAAADLDAHLAGPPTAGPLSIINFDRLDYWSKNLIVVDSITTFTTAVSYIYLNMPNIPVRSVIVFVQGNLETNITGGGGATRIGISSFGFSPSLYGQFSSLVKNSKLNLIPSWSALLVTGAMVANAVLPDSTAGGTIGASGQKIRIKIGYLSLSSLPNAP